MAQLPGAASSQRLVCPRGVLDEQHDEGLPADSDALEAPERRRRATQPFGDLGRRYCEPPRDRRRSEGVVDGVDAGDLQANARGAFRHTEVEQDPVDAVRFDGAGGDVERRTRVATRRAAVVAEMADVRSPGYTGQGAAPRSTSSRPHAGALRRAARGRRHRTSPSLRATGRDPPPADRPR